MPQVILIAHNLRSTHNVGSLLRTAEGLGVRKVILSGYTPYPQLANDSRLPHITDKLTKQIHKTALDAESLVQWEHASEILPVMQQLARDGYQLVALEQTAYSHDLNTYEAPNKVALIVGREVEGIEPEIVDLCDEVLAIPMRGKKESFNVVQAAAMALYHILS